MGGGVGGGRKRCLLVISQHVPKYLSERTREQEGGDEERDHLTPDSIPAQLQ